MFILKNMKRNYKDTIQYRNDNKEFKLFLGISIGFYSVFFLVFLWVVFIVRSAGATLEMSLITFVIGTTLFFFIDLPYIIKTIAVKHRMNLISRNMDEVNLFQVQIHEHVNHWFSQSKFSVSFPYHQGVKKAETSWIQDSEELEGNLVEVGYIESLDELIVIRKVENDW